MSDFNTYLIEDARISMIKDTLPFGVMGGSAQNTYQTFPSNSSSPSSLIFNVQVPSMSTAIDREVLIQTTINFTIKCTDVPDEDLAINYGYSDALQAFPFNSLISTVSATINNTTMSLNQMDILPQLLKMNDDQVLQRYNSLTPSFPDTYYKFYSDALDTTANVLAGLDNVSLNQNLLPRGVFPITFNSIVHSFTEVDDDTGDETAKVDNSLISTGVNDTWTISCSVTVTEPLFLSPFANSENDKCAFLGINNMVLNFNIGSCNRFWSSANDYIQSITLNTTQPFTNANLLLNFLSLQPEQYSKISAKNIIPYLDMPRYLWQVGAIPALTAGTIITPSYQGTKVNFNNIQLNQIPDLMIIVCRKQMALQTWDDSNSFLAINGISINFNNQSGILSSANTTQLYLLSQKNGSNQTWTEYIGQANNNDNTTGQGEVLPSIGSILILNPAMDFGMQSYYTASSGGQYNLQFSMNVTNQDTDFAVDAEICLICVNSGMFITENGTSSTQTGILTKEVVLSAKNKSSDMDNSIYNRVVGGAVRRLRQIPFMHGFGKRDEPDMMPAGAMSAGSESGGAMHKHKIHRFLKR